MDPPPKSQKKKKVKRTEPTEGRKFLFKDGKLMNWQLQVEMIEMMLELK